MEEIHTNNSKSIYDLRWNRETRPQLSINHLHITEKYLIFVFIQPYNLKQIGIQTGTSDLPLTFIKFKTTAYIELTFDSFLDKRSWFSSPPSTQDWPEIKEKPVLDPLFWERIRMQARESEVALLSIIWMLFLCELMKQCLLILIQKAPFFSSLIILRWMACKEV